MSEYIFPQSDTLAESYPKLQDELRKQNKEDKRLQGEIDKHKDSNDHTADKVRYEGRIPKDNVKDALDTTDERIDNIVSQGGDDNTEIVDARYSTVKDKTYPVLKDRLEDIEKDTNIVETVTETSYDSVIPVPDSATNGQVSVVVGGSTITNLIEDTVVSPLTKELDSTKTYLLIKTDGGTINIDGVDTAVPTKISGKTSTTLTWDAGNIGLYELIDTETSKDVTELAQKYTYISGTKSTVGSARISSADETDDVKDRAYVTAVKDGKIVNLRSLPNGIKDEISLVDGRAIINTKKYTIQESDFIAIRTTYDNVDYIEIHKPVDAFCYDAVSSFNYGSVTIEGLEEFSGDYTNPVNIDKFTLMAHGQRIWIGVEKGTTLEQAKERLIGTTLTYQLAEPEIIPIRWTGLQAYENGTVYVDTVIPELGFYYDNGLESHYPDHPIKEVDTLYRVDKETGYKEPLDVSKCEIREDRLSFTHPDLVDGDLCDWDYVPMTESTRPETSLTFPTNLKASVNSLLDAEQINKKEHNIFKARLDNHDRDISRVQSDIDTHKSDKNNPHDVTKSQVGLGNVVNEEQATKSEFDTHTNETPEDNVHGLMGSVIVESGSNENGYYVKFGNGLMVCWVNDINFTYSVDYMLTATWTFPKEFKYADVFVSGTGTTAGSRYSRISLLKHVSEVKWVVKETGTAQLRIIALGDFTFSTDDWINIPGVLAIGRWK